MYHLHRLDNHLFFLSLFTIGIMSIILGRLFYLQITHNSYYFIRGKKNFLRTESIPPLRGTIFDCHNKILVSNRPMHNLAWQGTGNRTLAGNQIAMIRHLETILGKPIIDDVHRFRSVCSAEKYYKTTSIATDITLEQLSQIKEHYPDNTNISIQTHFQRWYPYSSYASHVIGYLSKSIGTLYGQMGIEKVCNTILKGHEGLRLKTINSFGQDIESIDLETAADGQDIHTTLDINLQSIAEEVFPSDRIGCIVIMDPTDGAIKALVSRPPFDPSLFLHPIHHNEWEILQQKKPFLNRVLNAYPPGSIFKLVTISAALEQGYLSPEQTWKCKGYVKFAGRKYWCNQRHGHGILNSTQIIAQSCNVLFFEMGKTIDIDLLAHYAAKFGLGLPTGIMLPEQKGLIPSRDWKLRQKGERWWQGETLSVTIGQSFLMATPLQIARMISSIFTGYLVTPRILTEERCCKEPLSLHPSTLEFLKESMRFVITSGTGQRLNMIKDIEIYAKTSTAQITDFSKRSLSDEFLEHAWFVAYFRYKDYTPLVFVTLVENAGTSKIPTAIAKQFLIHYRSIAHLV